jgi:hypothetical protein
MIKALMYKNKELQEEIWKKDEIITALRKELNDKAGSTQIHDFIDLNHLKRPRESDYLAESERETDLSKSSRSTKIKREHDGTYPCPNEECGKIFIKKSDLKSHLVVEFLY